MLSLASCICVIAVSNCKRLLDQKDDWQCRQKKQALGEQKAERTKSKEIDLTKLTMHQIISWPWQNGSQYIYFYVCGITSLPYNSTLQSPSSYITVASLLNKCVFLFNPFSPNINIYFLLTFLHIFMLLV